MRKSQNDVTTDPAGDEAAMVVDEVLIMPGWASWDEHSLSQVISQEIGNLVPMPFDDDWPDLEMEVMARLEDARNKAR